MLQAISKNKTGNLLVLFLCCVFCVTGCGGRKKSYIEKKTEQASEKAADSKLETGRSESKSNLIYVDIEGAIKSPGVYKVKMNSRVVNVIEKAGGLSEDAYVGNINQASKVEDGQKIYVFFQKEYEESKESKSTSSSGSASSNEADGKININTASRDELMKLPGVGESKADCIIKYREKNGAFKNAKDIMKIPGIKTGVFDKIENLIKVD